VGHDRAWWGGVRSDIVGLLARRGWTQWGDGKFGLVKLDGRGGEVGWDKVGKSEVVRGEMGKIANEHK